MKIKTLLLIGLLMLTACATTENYKLILNTWVGAPVDRLVSSWGIPQGSFDLPDGGKIIEYVRSNNVQTGGYTYTVPQTTQHTIYGPSGQVYTGTSTTYVTQQAPTQNWVYWCKTRFTVSPEGIITNWSFEGNNCRALKPK